MTQVCPRCGFRVPFQGCPSCPPRFQPCLNCGELVLVEPLPDEQAAEFLRRYRERGR